MPIAEKDKMKKKKIKIRWTCSNYCHIEHRNQFTAWLHGRIILIKHLLTDLQLTSCPEQKMNKNLIKIFNNIKSLNHNLQSLLSCELCFEAA